jgi:hypothetical protein
MPHGTQWRARRVAETEHVHIHREGLVAQKVIVERGDLDAAFLELLHDRANLLARQHEVPHRHSARPHFLEGEPRAQSKSRLQLDPIERRLDVGSGKADAIDPARSFGARLAKCLGHLLLPIVGGKGWHG